MLDAKNGGAAADSLSLGSPLSILLTFSRGEFGFKLLLALVQCLQTKLPAVDLNIELIDIPGDLCSLRFVFF
ncbi:MAG: hypothetical protein WA183_04680 [Chthoniobacterales bacterium]